jgi:predicted HTH transcriptional regulator
MIGAVGKGKDNKLHPTAAGLLMFSQEWRITSEFPHYFLDYQENDGTNERWTDRFISSSGDWSGNLYDFFFRVVSRLAQEVKVPFKLDDKSIRVDNTPVRNALREVLANALVNASYYDRRGLVVKRWPGEITIENPGGFRIPFEDARRGGRSDPRNETLLKMFNLIGIGERAGSGIPNLYAVWEAEGWPSPTYREEFGPDRTILTMALNTFSHSPNLQGNLQGNLQEKLSEKACAVLDLVRADPSITIAEIAVRTGATNSAISQRIRTLKQKGILLRVGPDKGGHWEIASGS